MGNRMRVNGGKWMSLPKYGLGKPLHRPRCPICERFTEASIQVDGMMMGLCHKCQPITNHADSEGVWRILKALRNKRLGIKKRSVLARVLPWPTIPELR